MIDAYKKFLRNYTNFKGRSTVSDYWWVVLCNAIIGFALGLMDGFLKIDIFSKIIIVYELAILIPGIALFVRRLHDTNKKWTYMFMGLIPLVGGILLIIQVCKPSVNEGNNFGEIAK